MLPASHATRARSPEVAERERSQAVNKAEADAARRRERAQEREQRMQQRIAEHEARQKSRSKPPAAPLPLPGASGASAAK
jgi:colicin import membrane protein